MISSVALAPDPTMPRQKNKDVKPPSDLIADEVGAPRSPKANSMPPVPVRRRLPWDLTEPPERYQHKDTRP